MIPIRLYAYAAGTVAIAAGVLWYGHSRYEAGEAAGKATVTAQWQADTKARDAADAAIRAENAAKAEADRKRNDEVIRDYTEKLSAASGSLSDYNSLLQRARNQIRTLSSREATSALIASESSKAASDAAIRYAAELDAATAALRVEAGLNAEQLDALIAVVKGQM